MPNFSKNAQPVCRAGIFIPGKALLATGFLLIAAAFNTLSTRALAAGTELLMVEEPGCVYCAKFNREISVAYAKTDEGKTAPLRRLDLNKTWPASLSHIQRPKYTPTFILMHDNREVGRLVGYNGDEYFWFLLGELIQKIDEPTADRNTATTKSEL